MASVYIHLLYDGAKLRVSHTLGNFLQHEEDYASKGFLKEKQKIVSLNTFLCQIQLTSQADTKTEPMPYGKNC
jgi:hypothetical protein